jgi:DDE superfamily endonuclease
MTGTYIWPMEDVRYQYQLPYEPRHPLRCFDERPCCLIEDVGAILPMSPGKAKRYHDEYANNGACWVFRAFEPHTGFRDVEVRARRTAVDDAALMNTLSELHYPHAASIRRVQDKLHTHTPGAFYEVRSPDQAFALAKRVAPHDTPPKGAWLKMADMECSVLSHQGLDRRIPAFATLRRDVLAGADTRNRARKTGHWRFAPQDARNTLQRHYHKVQKFN